jgi:hypothetical protein
MPANEQVSRVPEKGQKGDKLANYVNVLQQESAGAPPPRSNPRWEYTLVTRSDHTSSRRTAWQR